MAVVCCSTGVVVLPACVSSYELIAVQATPSIVTGHTGASNSGVEEHLT